MPSQNLAQAGSSGSGVAVVAGTTQKALLALAEESAAHSRVPAWQGGAQLGAAAIHVKTLAATSKMLGAFAAAASAQALSDSLSAQVKIAAGGAVAQWAASMPRIAVAETLAASVIAAAGPWSLVGMSQIVAQAEAAQFATAKALAHSIAQRQALVGQVVLRSVVTPLRSSPRLAVRPARRGETAPVWPAADPLRFRGRVQSRLGGDLVWALERVGLVEVAKLLVSGWENLDRRTPAAVSIVSHVAIEVIDRTLKRVAPEQQVQEWLTASGRMSADKARRTTVAERLEFTSLLLGAPLADELTAIKRALVQLRMLGQGGKHASEGSLGAAARLLQIAEMLIEIVVIEGQLGDLRA